MWGQIPPVTPLPPIPDTARLKFVENAFRQQTIGRTQDNLTKLFQQNKIKQQQLQEEWNVLELDTLTKMKLDTKKFHFDFDKDSTLVVVPVEDKK